MRRPKYLSPSSISLWQKDPEAFYLKYLSDNPPPSEPQTQAMAVGSAFDAYIKSHLYSLFVGSPKGTIYEFDNLFEAQVEEHNRDQAKRDGFVVFEAYSKRGGLADLLLLMKDCKEPRFEFRLENIVTLAGVELYEHNMRELNLDALEGDGSLPYKLDEVSGKSLAYKFGEDHGQPGLVLLGKPDLHFYRPDGRSVILDWKVNGFYASRTISPAKGYIKYLVDGVSTKAHKDAVISNIDGITINAACTLDMAKQDWAQQLSIYAWLLGEPIGSAFVTAIDQLVCYSGSVQGIAQHRTVVTRNFQEDLLVQAVDLWRRCWGPLEEVFNGINGMGPDESRERCLSLDREVDAEFWEAIRG